MRVVVGVLGVHWLLFQTFAHVAGILLAVAGYRYSRAWVGTDGGKKKEQLQIAPHLCWLLPGQEVQSVQAKKRQQTQDGDWFEEKEKEKEKEGENERKRKGNKQREGVMGSVTGPLAVLLLSVTGVCRSCTLPIFLYRGKEELM